MGPSSKRAVSRPSRPFSTSAYTDSKLAKSRTVQRTRVDTVRPAKNCRVQLHVKTARARARELAQAGKRRHVEDDSTDTASAAKKQQPSSKDEASDMNTADLPACE